MKKIVLFLLCLCMVLPLSSCFYVCQEHDLGDESFTDINDTDPPYPEDSKKPEKEEESEEEKETEHPTTVIKKGNYYKTETDKHGKTKYSIYDINGNLAFSDETYDPPALYNLGEYMLAISYSKEPNGNVCQFYDAKNNRLSKKYTNLITYNEELAIYLEKKIDNRVLVAKSIFDDTFYKEYALDFSAKQNPIRFYELRKNKLYLSYDAKANSTCNTLLSLYETDYDYFTDYGSIVKLTEEICTAARYYEDQVDYSLAFGITDAQQSKWVDALFISIFAIYAPQDEHRKAMGYALKDLNGDGVVELILLNYDYKIAAIFTTVDGKPYLLDHYWDGKSGYVDHTGKIYVKEGSDTDAICSVYQFASNNASLELIEQFETLGYPYCSMTESCAKLNFTYLSEDWVVRQACAKQAFLSVLTNKMKIYNTQTREYCYLSDCKLPSTNTPLSKAEGLRYALADLDHDAVKELIIDGGDRLVLRYGHGTVYLYPSVLQNMYQLNTNGSYNWRCEDQNAAHGASRLSFDGTDVREKVLWRIVNDGEPNAEYYIEGWEVTQAELTRYREVHSVTPIEYGALSFPFQVNISPQKALNIANTYWDEPVGKRDAACGTRLTYRVALQEEPYDTVGYYHVVLLCEHSSLHEGSGTVRYVADIRHLLVDMRTGECLTYVIQNGK